MTSSDPNDEARPQSAAVKNSRDKAQYGAAVLLAAIGAATVLDATVLNPGRGTPTDPIGPTVVPVTLGICLLIVAALYARDVSKGGRGIIDDDEDTDPSTPMSWRTVMVLAGAFVAAALTVDVLGWVISSAGLFFGVVTALGARKPVLSVGISVVLALLTYYAFGVGLGLNFPAGILQGVL